jgi:hypothetical protein
LLPAEKRPAGKIGRIYLKKITDYTKETLYPIIKSVVSKDAAAVSDKYPNYA